jgi:PPP family 3-phenylpropionic acid transporter
MGMAIQPLGIGVIPATLLILFAGLWMASLAIPERAVVERHTDQRPILRVVARPRVVALLVICFLVQASHGPYYAFYSIYLKELGHSGTVIGLLWGLGVFAEVLIFLMVPRLLLRFGARRLMMVTLALSTCRWLLIGHVANHTLALLLAQVLHAFSFGLYHTVAIYLIHQFFTGAHQGRGQAIYSSLSFGAGGALGNLAAGFLWTSWGPEGTYTVAAGLSAAGLGVAWRWLRTDP